ncbi:hypothetical protein ON010_g18801 [Phytophthora cinnamomi]|nr:hypothetical protein ON010_g18801 [Phytophthora cinnamomi]
MLDRRVEAGIAGKRAIGAKAAITVSPPLLGWRELVAKSSVESASLEATSTSTSKSPPSVHTKALLSSRLDRNFCELKLALLILLENSLSG